MTARARLAALLLAGLAVPLAGCGGGSRSADEERLARGLARDVAPSLHDHVLVHPRDVVCEGAGPSYTCDVALDAGLADAVIVRMAVEVGADGCWRAREVRVHVPHGRDPVRAADAGPLRGCLA